MAEGEEEWRPGSFTKNFSWGRDKPGLQELHGSIRIGFDNQVANVPREVFRERVRGQNRPEFIPINYFLFNESIDGVDHLVADELVFQAITSDHSDRFDKLALFTFLLGYAGKWRGAMKAQRRPTLWASAYVRERVAESRWDTRVATSKDIGKFVSSDPRYTGKTVGKLGSNLAYIFKKGHLDEFTAPRIERWWVDAFFLALDRIIGDRALDGRRTAESEYTRLIFGSRFLELTGGATLEKELATKHLVQLYIACGGRERFSDEFVIERTKELLEDEEPFRPNDPRPRGAVHLTNPRVLKSIPPICAMLAKYAGFVDIDPGELEDFNLEDFIKKHTEAALQSLREQDIRPTMTAEEIMRITRER